MLFKFDFLRSSLVGWQKYEMRDRWWVFKQCFKDRLHTLMPSGYVSVVLLLMLFTSIFKNRPKTDSNTRKITIRRLQWKLLSMNISQRDGNFYIVFIWIFVPPPLVWETSSYKTKYPKNGFVNKGIWRNLVICSFIEWR